MTTGGVTARYNWDMGWNVINEEDGAGALVRTYTHNPQSGGRATLGHVDGSSPATGGFELPEGDSSLVLLDFESFHLVQAGNSGKYVLTPQLRATIQVQSAEAQATGAIVAVDPATSMLTLDVDDSDATLDVNFSAADILLADLTPGTPADLTLGANVQVTGTLSVSGVLTADTITLIAP